MYGDPILRAFYLFLRILGWRTPQILPNFTLKKCHFGQKKWRSIQTTKHHVFEDAKMTCASKNWIPHVCLFFANYQMLCMYCSIFLTI